MIRIESLIGGLKMEEFYNKAGNKYLNIYVFREVIMMESHVSSKSQQIAALTGALSTLHCVRISIT